MYGLAVVAMTEVLQQRVARNLYFHSTARTLNCGDHHGSPRCCGEAWADSIMQGMRATNSSTATRTLEGRWHVCGQTAWMSKCCLSSSTATSLPACSLAAINQEGNRARPAPTVAAS